MVEREVEEVQENGRNTTVVISNRGHGSYRTTEYDKEEKRQKTLLVKTCLFGARFRFLNKIGRGHGSTVDGLARSTNLFAALI